MRLNKDLGLTESNPIAVLITEGVKELGKKFAEEPNETKRHLIRTLNLSIKARENKKTDDVTYVLENEFLNGVTITIKGRRKNEKHGKTKLLENVTFKTLFGYLYE